MIFLLQWLSLLTSGQGNRPSLTTNWSLDHWWPRPSNESVFSLVVALLLGWKASWWIHTHWGVQVHPDWEITHSDCSKEPWWNYLNEVFGVLLFIVPWEPSEKGKRILCSLSFFFKSTATVALGHRESLILTQQNCVVGESREDSLPGSLFSTERLWKLNIWKCPSHFEDVCPFLPQIYSVPRPPSHAGALSPGTQGVNVPNCLWTLWAIPYLFQL